VAKQVAKSNGIKIPSAMAQEPAILAVRIQALEDALQHVTTVNQQNQEALKKAFLYTDAHLFVLRTLSVDIVNGTVKHVSSETPDGPHGEIDFSAYYKAFNEHYAKQNAPKLEDKSAEELLGDAPEEIEEMSPEIFGGDAAPSGEAIHV